MAMDVKTVGASIDIDTTSIQVITSPTLLTAGAAGRRSIIIFNNAAAGGSVVYVGGNDVVVGGSGTANSGFPIPPQTSLALDIAGNIGSGNPFAGGAGQSPAGIWGIVSSGTVDVRVLEIS